ncbi:hypothetical protein EI94DRAFT_127977 [Lactarius quietus]|nr:hypothetical protein EI94DRAFT_127977 [Lactarius quietus]
MLHVLPTEVTLDVLAHLPIPALLSLRLLSCQWRDFFATHQSVIFHGAAIHHGYIPPGTLSLEDALSVNTGRPLAGSTSWKDLCRRSIQLQRNWEGKGRTIARVLMPHTPDVRLIKVDEKAGTCIANCSEGGLTVTHLFSGTVLWHLPSVGVIFHTSLCQGAKIVVGSGMPSRASLSSTTMGILSLEPITT